MIEEDKLKGPDQAQHQILDYHEIVDGCRVYQLGPEEDVLAPKDPEEAKVPNHVPQIAVDEGHHVAGEEEPGEGIVERVPVPTCGRNGMSSVSMVLRDGSCLVFGVTVRLAA